MRGWTKSRDGLGKLLPLGLGAAAFLAFSAGASAEMSEIDAFQRAINSQSKKDALAFIDDFGTSHLVPDLIELLRPEVAADVCASAGVVISTQATARNVTSPIRQRATVIGSDGSILPLAPVTLSHTRCGKTVDHPCKSC